MTYTIIPLKPIDHPFDVYETPELGELAELDSIILELNRIAHRRRFMRQRILKIGHQLDYVGDWIVYCHEKNRPFPKLHIRCVMHNLLDDLKGVIVYKKYMRDELCSVLERLHFVLMNLCDDDVECHW